MSETVNKDINYADKLFNKNKDIFTHIILNYEEPGMHRHDYIEFFYVLEGNCLHILNGKSKKITCGDAFLLTPKDLHNFKNSGCNFVHRDIAFSMEFFNRVCKIYSEDLFNTIMGDSFLKQIKLTSEQINELEAFVQPYILDSIQDSSLSEKTYAGALCSYIINAFLKQNLQLKTNLPAWITRLLSLLSAPENFSTPQQTFIEFFPYSQEYICRTFKKTIGKTITDYFNEQKMQYAYSLLQSTSNSIEEICSLININNVPYFYRLFKKQFGITPREVTKQEPSQPI